MDSSPGSRINLLSGVNYSRQSEMEASLSIDRQGSHFIVGCGGVGFWLGLTLAMYGVESLTLFDADKLEDTNIARIPVPPYWTGINKAVALRKLIRYLRPECVVTVLAINITDTTLEFFKDLIRREGSTPPVVWDATDDSRAQEIIYRGVKDAVCTLTHCSPTMPCTHYYRKIGYEGWEVAAYPHYEAMWDTSATLDTTLDTTSATTLDTPLDASQPTPTLAPARRGYRTSTANVFSSMFAALIGIASKGFDSTTTTKVSLRNLILPPILPIPVESNESDDIYELDEWNDSDEDEDEDENEDSQDSEDSQYSEVDESTSWTTR